MMTEAQKQALQLRILQLTTSSDFTDGATCADIADVHLRLLVSVALTNADGWRVPAALTLEKHTIPALRRCIEALREQGGHADADVVDGAVGH